MSLLFRLGLTLFMNLFKKPIGFLEPSVIVLRVFPNDLDAYWHVNNGRYLTMMDIGRVDLMLRTKMWNVSRKRGWTPLVASVKIDYKRSLKLFDRFELRTRIVGWDEKWFYIEQTFRVNEDICAHAIVKGLFRGREGKILSADLLKALGKASAVSPTVYSENLEIRSTSMHRNEHET